ncbi:MAG: divergent polysaccharide deacetylase family protein [Candidatus Omnitrophica bacterium]|nr:divergent polysaccharide deacetylase family protein [Candidatus Omnitrophota bacterium]MBU1869677.1 divergent polysaccharide deacetylase family protein [Candidatus Omnitrophota bacterium]
MRDKWLYKLIIAILVLIIAGLAVFILRISYKQPKKPAPLKAKARIAIVIDDWGYNTNSLKIAGEIGYPITASVLPNLNSSKNVAEELHKRGFEIILHLPMAPRAKIPLEKNTILPSMDIKTIKTIISQDLSGIPHVKGVSNHMGSKITEDSQIIEIIFNDLKKRNIYFLDSYVTANSICSGSAVKIGLPFARRDVFLDNTGDSLYIKGQLNKLKRIASQKGSAIGIGHDRPVTLKVLKEEMPKMEEEGYKFVFVSELVK